MSALFITRAARADLKNDCRIHAKDWGVAQRRIYLKGLDATFRFLVDNPDAGTTCDYVMPGLRKHPNEQHVVFYERHDGAVVIVRVLHRSMDVELHLPKA